jgi:hypothetical protein
LLSSILSLGISFTIFLNSSFLILFSSLFFLSFSFLSLLYIYPSILNLYICYFLTIIFLFIYSFYFSSTIFILFYHFPPLILLLIYLIYLYFAISLSIYFHTIFQSSGDNRIKIANIVSQYSVNKFLTKDKAIKYKFYYKKLKLCIFIFYWKFKWWTID